MFLYTNKYLSLDFRLFQLPCHGIATHWRPVNARPWPSRQTNSNSNRIFNILENYVEIFRFFLIRFRMQLQSGASCRIVLYRVASCSVLLRMAGQNRLCSLRFIYRARTVLAFNLHSEHAAYELRQVAEAGSKCSISYIVYIRYDTIRCIAMRYIACFQRN